MGSLPIPELTIRRIQTELLCALAVLGVVSATAAQPALSFLGIQTTVPVIGLSGPAGVAVDAAGNVFIADTLNNRVVEVPAGIAASAVSGPVSPVTITGIPPGNEEAVRPNGMVVQ